MAKAVKRTKESNSTVPWTKEQIDLLIKMRPNHFLAEIVAEFNKRGFARSKRAIDRKAFSLNLKYLGGSPSEPRKMKIVLPIDNAPRMDKDATLDRLNKEFQKRGKTGKIFVIPDLHFPYVRKGDLETIYAGIAREKPDVIVQLGDAVDLYCFSKYDRSLDFVTPEEEVSMAFAALKEFWGRVKKAAPKATLFQLAGNHENRLLKRLRDRLPEFESIVKVNDLFAIGGVVTLSSERDFLELYGVIFTHGWKSRLGDHAKFFLRPVVCGHSHRPGIAYESTGNGYVFELNCGWLGDQQLPPFKYTQCQMTKWIKGYGVVEFKDGACEPRFIPVGN